MSNCGCGCSAHAGENAKNKEIKKPVVESSCIGCGACVAIAWEAFELNNEWISVTKKLDNYEWKHVEDAVSACPVWAIKY